MVSPPGRHLEFETFLRPAIWQDAGPHGDLWTLPDSELGLREILRQMRRGPALDTGSG
jgi:hypothetical protein